MWITLRLEKRELILIQKLLYSHRNNLKKDRLFAHASFVIRLERSIMRQVKRNKEVKR